MSVLLSFLLLSFIPSQNIITSPTQVEEKISNKQPSNYKNILFGLLTDCYPHIFIYLLCVIGNHGENCPHNWVYHFPPYW